MITEDQLEQLAIQWFQDTGWNCVHAAVIAPEGVAAEREEFRAVVLKGRLAEAVRRFASRQISRQSVARKVVGHRDMNRDTVSRFGGDSGRKPGIATEIPTKWREFALVERGEAESRQFSRHHVQIGRKKDHGMCRPFRAWNRVGDGNPGRGPGLSCDAPLGRWKGIRRAINKERRYPIALPMRGPWGSGLPRFMGFPWTSADGFRRSLGMVPRRGGIERNQNHEQR